MTTTNTVDAARVELLLSELRLPGIKLRWAKLAEQSDKEGWPAARFLAALAEHEVADRSCRRMERHLAEARLPAGKTLTIQHLQVARRDLTLESAIAKLDRTRFQPWVVYYPSGARLDAVVPWLNELFTRLEVSLRFETAVVVAPKTHKNNALK